MFVIGAIIGLCCGLVPGIYFSFKYKLAWKEAVYQLKSHLEKKEQWDAASAEALERNSKMLQERAEVYFEKHHQKVEHQFTTKHESLEKNLAPYKEMISKLEESLNKIEKERKGESSALLSQIHALRSSKEELKEQTAELIHCLKNPQSRGTWGEVQLKRIVEYAGLLSHVHFVEQKGIEGGYRPDMIITMPGGRKIVVDSKVPMESYLEGYETNNELKFKEHAKQLKNHITDLAKKDYSRYVDESPDFIVLFLPAEVLFSSALQQDPTLLEVASKKGVVLASPSTFVALLKALSCSFRQENFVSQAKEIAALGTEVHKRMLDFLQHMGGVGRSLSSSIDAYNKMVGSFDHRLSPSIKKLEKWGAAEAQTTLPQEIEKVVRKSKEIKADSK